MTDYWVFQSEQVVATKFILFGVIHSLLIFAVLEGAIRQNRKVALLLPVSFWTLLCPGILSRLMGACIGGSGVAVFSAALGLSDYIGTMMIANAACLTLWYVECAILLARGFFARLFGDDLPYEIRLFVSFIVMVNAGYFTLMFMMSILRAPAL